MVILAPYGGSLVKVSTIIASAFFGSIAGGNLIEILAPVEDLTTLPAMAIGGRPSAPVIDMFGFQTLSKYI
jgi:hypothetical protein